MKQRGLNGTLIHLKFPYLKNTFNEYLLHKTKQKVGFLKNNSRYQTFSFFCYIKFEFSLNKCVLVCIFLMFGEFHEFHGTMFVLFMISNLDTPHTPLIILYVCFFFFSIRWCRNILYKTGISSFLISHPEIASIFPGTAKIYDRFIYV